MVFGRRLGGVYHLCDSVATSFFKVTFVSSSIMGLCNGLSVGTGIKFFHCDSSQVFAPQNWSFSFSIDEDRY